MTGVQFPLHVWVYFFATMFGLALELAHALIQWVLEGETDTSRLQGYKFLDHYLSALYMVMLWCLGVGQLYL
jgi:hypothetical protein